MIGFSIVPSTEFCENRMVKCSILLMVMRLGCLFFRYLRVLHTAEVRYVAKHKDFSYGKHAPHPVKQAPPETIRSYSVGMTYLI